MPIKLRAWLDTQTECKDEAARHEVKEHPAKRTVIRLTSKAGFTPIEATLKWEDEDGPTSEDITEAAVGLIRAHWLSEGDTITVTTR